MLRYEGLTIGAILWDTGTYPHRFVQAFSEIIWNTPGTFHCGETQGTFVILIWHCIGSDIYCQVLSFAVHFNMHVRNKTPESPILCIYDESNMILTSHKSYQQLGVNSPNSQWSPLQCCPLYQSQRASCRHQTLWRTKQQHFDFRAINYLNQKITWFFWTYLFNWLIYLFIYLFCV